MLIKLKWHEVQMAWDVGVNRAAHSIRMELKDAHGWRPDPVSDIGWQCLSASSELAVAKALHLYWNGSVNTFSRPDLPNIEIKSQLHHVLDRNKQTNFLIVRKNMPDDQRYVLVVVHSKLIIVLLVLFQDTKQNRRSISHKEWAESRSMKCR